MKTPGLVLAAATAGLYFLSFSQGWPLWASWALKAFPAIALAIVAFDLGKDAYSRTISRGLIVSAAADVLIEWRFLAGLAAFLVAHVLYMSAFVEDVRAVRFIRSIPVAVGAALVLGRMQNGLGEARGPVAAYIMVIGTMIWRAWARVGSSPRGRASQASGAVGATLFGVSDSLIGLSRFGSAPVEPFAIMALYWAGQTGIALSASRKDGGS